MGNCRDSRLGSRIGSSAREADLVPAVQRVVEFAQKGVLGTPERRRAETSSSIIQQSKEGRMTGAHASSPVILNPAVDLETATGFAAPYN